MLETKKLTYSLHLSKLMKKFGARKKDKYDGEAAVAIILNEAQDELNILLVKRASRHNDP